jgi:hypothetical protein
MEGCRIVGSLPRLKAPFRRFVGEGPPNTLRSSCNHDQRSAYECIPTRLPHTVVTNGFTHRSLEQALADGIAMALELNKKGRLKGGLFVSSECPVKLSRALSTVQLGVPQLRFRHRLGLFRSASVH